MGYDLLLFCMDDRISWVRNGGAGLREQFQVGKFQVGEFQVSGSYGNACGEQIEIVVE